MYRLNTTEVKRLAAAGRAMAVVNDIYIDVLHKQTERNRHWAVTQPINNKIANACAAATSKVYQAALYVGHATAKEGESFTVQFEDSYFHNVTHIHRDGEPWVLKGGDAGEELTVYGKLVAVWGTGQGGN